MDASTITPHPPLASKNYDRQIQVVTRKKHSDGFELVDAALEAWARWGRSALSGIGWSSWTLLARVIEQGFTGAAQKSGRTFEVDEAMELVERAVLRLESKERQVVCKHYLYWQSPEVSAAHCQMSHAHFRVVLNRARRRVWDYLDGSRQQHCVSNNDPSKVKASTL